MTSVGVELVSISIYVFPNICANLHASEVSLQSPSVHTVCTYTLCKKEQKSLIIKIHRFLGIDVNGKTTMFVFLLALHNGPLEGKGSFTWKY